LRLNTQTSHLIYKTSSHGLTMPMIGNGVLVWSLLIVYDFRHQMESG